MQAIFIVLEPILNYAGKKLHDNERNKYGRIWTETYFVREDDPDIRTVAKISFEIVGGFELNCCASGMDALQQIRNGYVPDLLLLDVMMPVMDGPTTLFGCAKWHRLPIPCCLYDRQSAIRGAGVLPQPRRTGCDCKTV
jgi:hypothetical protein